MASSSPGCIIHFDGKEGELKTLTYETLSKIIERRKQWLQLPAAYKEFTEVAKKSFEFLSDQVEASEQLLATKYSYHIKCYRNFTDISKIERAAKTLANVQSTKVATDDDSPSIPRKTTRAITLQSLGGRIPLPQSLSTNVLPKFCLICKGHGPIYITDKVRSFNFLKFSPYLKSVYLLGKICD